MFPLSGMKAFSVIWFGQLVSLLGTGMTRFALLIWAYQQTGAVTAVALLGFFSFVPFILVSPFAGVIIDRYDRRKIMIWSDLGAALSTVCIMLLFVSGVLQVWHLLVLQFATGVFESFQSPAYSASMTMLIPRKHIERANGMRSLALYAGEIAAPFLAGGLLVLIGTGGIMVIDLLTFCVSMVALALCRIPAPQKSAVSAGDVSRFWHKFWNEVTSGYRYIFERKGLLGLVGIFMGMNLFAGLTYSSIMPAMILARTGGDEIALAGVQSVLGLGGFVGGMLVSIFGLPRPRTRAIFLGGGLSFVLGDLMFAVGRTPIMWMAAGFVAAIFIPFILSAMNAIWQVKVAPEMQGRVFAAQNMFRNLTTPIGFLLAGPLADLIFEPGMANGGVLTPLFGPIVGTGAGAGMAVMFLFTGVCGALMSVSGLFFPVVRDVERDLPDYDLDEIPVSPEPVVA